MGARKESYTPIVIVYWVLCAVSILLFAMAIFNVSSICKGWIALMIAPIGLLVWWSFLFCRIPGGMKRREFRKDWEEIKKNEVNQATNK